MYVVPPNSFINSAVITGIHQSINQLITLQNIDGLERVAGIDPDLLMEAHGSNQVGHCMECSKKYTNLWIRGQSIPLILNTAVSFYFETKLKFCCVENFYFSHGERMTRVFKPARENISLWSLLLGILQIV